MEDLLSFDLALLPDPRAPLHLKLNAALTLEVLDRGLLLEKVIPAEETPHAGINDAGSPEQENAMSTLYRLSPPKEGWGEGRGRVKLRYSGHVVHGFSEEEQDYARSFSRTAGTISPEGVYLSSSTWWLPRIGEELITFRMSTDLPAGWKSVSEGMRVSETPLDGRNIAIWESDKPLQEVHLIAGKFTEFSRRAGHTEAMAFLLQPDEALASRYLEATATYLAMYEELLGPYPYGKFALVENFWDTGYGMASFTLLGSNVIRLPFILHSSYPHEILHNWWGNSVYVDYDKGNWCEGLTAYMADHLIREGQGRGVSYRRDTLKRYKNYVSSGEDFPLADFVTRHSAATEAVGYGKSLMLWHMLRQKVGDEVFIDALREVISRHTYKTITFMDIAAVFSEISGEDLIPFFDQWVARTGAPSFALDVTTGVEATEIVVRQTQASDVYDIDVPLWISWREGEVAERLVLRSRSRETRVRLDGNEPPLAVQLDARFDLFRRPESAELPPALGQIFGAASVQIVLPDDSTGIPSEAWLSLANAWSDHGDGTHVEVVKASDFAGPSADTALWFLGRSEPAHRIMDDLLSDLESSVSDTAWTVHGETISPSGHSAVYVARHPLNEDLAVGWILTTVPEAVAGLARKLPHYGKYSYLAFAGTAPDNTIKGAWPITNSPLLWRLKDEAKPSFTFPPAEPLARPAPVFDETRLLDHVETLASDDMLGRGAGSAGLEASAAYIEKFFEKIGLEPGGDDGGYRQNFVLKKGPGNRPVSLSNIVGVLRGTKAEWSTQSVVLGAHYDHLGHGEPDVHSGDEGKIHNGADDNASGVAVLLETARLLASGGRPSRSLIFVAFSGEEWGLEGSRYYAEKISPWPASDILGMINLDTVGRLNGRPIQVLGTGSADEWIHIARGIKFTTGIESKTIRDDPGGSDQKSFHQVGVPAIQLFSGGHLDYHRPTDDTDKIDSAGLVDVATFAKETLAYLAEREEALTSNLSAGDERSAKPAKAKSSRRVSLGTMPDFAYSGPGVRVETVTPGSAAEAAGIEPKDMLISIDGVPIESLRHFSQILRSHAPGDEISIEIERGGERLTKKAVLKTR